MKKYLLSALLGVFGLFGFTNALQIYGDGVAYTPSSIVLKSNSVLSDILSTEQFYSCSDVPCSFVIDGVDCSFSKNSKLGSTQMNGCTDSVSAGTYNISVLNDTIAFNSFNLSDEYFGEINSGGGDITEGGLIIQNGTSELSPIITSIFSVMGEFIPYVVYIGIGILLCTLGFTAIKRLMNRLSGKITKYFK